MTAQQPVVPAEYVIINDCDQPRPDMVCQWIKGVGYCYLDRNKGKQQYDGMSGIGGTSLAAFGFTWTNNSDGTVSFYRTEREPKATYKDGLPRRWQSPVSSFEHRRLKKRRGCVAPVQPPAGGAE